MPLRILGPRIRCLMATRTGTIVRIVASQKIACASSILTASMTDGSKECDDNPGMRYGAIPSHLSVCWRQRAVTVSTTATIRFWDQGVLLCHYSHERMGSRSEEHTSELQSRFDLVCRLLLEKK